MRNKIFFLLLFCIFTLSSCHVKKKEYIEKNGLHSGTKPSEMSKEAGKLSKRQNREYMKQLKRAKRDRLKRNLQKSSGKYYE